MKISLRFASYAGHGKFSTSIIKSPFSIASNCFEKQETFNNIKLFLAIEIRLRSGSCARQGGSGGNGRYV